MKAKIKQTNRFHKDPAGGSDQYNEIAVETEEGTYLCSFYGMLAESAANTFIKHFNEGTLEGSDPKTETINKNNEKQAPIEHKKPVQDYRVVDGKIFIQIKWHREKGEDETKEYFFDTLDEKINFMRGLNAALIWTSYLEYPVDNHEKKISIEWGSTYDPENPHPTIYEFNTLKEKKCFIAGITRGLEEKDYHITEFEQ